MMRKILAILLAILTIASIGVFSTGVSAADELVVERVVAIDDYNIVVEFSDSVAFNLNGSAIGPWVAIRVMDGASLISDSGGPAQIGGTVNFISDGTTSRMIFTMDTNNAMGVTALPAFLNKEGDFARFADYDIMFCIEEIHAKVGATPKDYLVENVTTTDGAVALKATTDVEQDAHYEGCYMPIEMDPEYVLYPETEEEAPAVEESAPEKEEAGPNNGGGSLSFVETAQPQVIVPSWIMPSLIAMAGACLVLIVIIVLQALKIKKLKK